eukprot:g2953.t1
MMNTMMKMVVAAIAVVAHAHADDQCPGSGAFLTHAKTKLEVTFGNSCADVRSVIQGRAEGTANGQWVDPHNKGTYTVESSSDSQMALQRETGNKKYTDKMLFTFTDNGDSSCSVVACSESQVTSVKDFSTNFCNLHDLYCMDAGCNAIAGATQLSVTNEKIDTCSSGQHSTSDCYQTSVSLLEGAMTDATLYEIKDGVCGETTLDAKYVSYAEKFDGNLKEGTCAPEGYTVPAGSESHSYPFVGTITVKKFTKPSSVLFRGSDSGDACKPVDTPANFDLDAYMSKRWYIQQQMAVSYLPESQNYCVYAEYEKLKKKSFWGYTVQVHNYAQEKDGTVHDSKSIICAKVDSNYDTDAKLRVGLCALPRVSGVTTGPYWIVAYDEAKGYALVSGGQPTKPSGNGTCKTGSGVNNSGLWIFTRAQKRDESLVNEVRAIAAAKGFDLSVLNDVDQSNCNF